ncbi:MAG: SpoIID/LytB domain-containing protein [Bacteroidales bacterium]|jgi:stage II sporulation protein D|nr:SpoIID/LytB domain-containing protein [Bacteroidales bacterium]
MMKRIVLIILLVFTVKVFGLNIQVKLLSEYQLDKVDVNIVSGTYTVLCDNMKIIPVDLSAGTSLTLTCFEEKVRMERGLELIGFFSEIEFIGTKYNNVFSLKTASIPKERVYEENLHISTCSSELLLVNIIGLEKYIAGVVQSEVFGSSDDVEFFKIQAIASRTYCLANLNRHLTQGYNLCDGIHCHAYKGKCTHADILRATYETFNDVVVDTSNKLISTAYHSNSGGMTEAAVNVWLKDIPYLQSVKDTFSVGARNYHWEKIIPKKQWIAYFTTMYGAKYTQAEYQEKILNFTQEQRIAKWIIETDTILTKEIRSYFKLRSSYFSVQTKGENVYLNGKGYGHGVGLSQEGAIQMVKQGYSAAEIFRFYYHDVRIIKYTDIINF